jgi:hypothetical protein
LLKAPRAQNALKADGKMGASELPASATVALPLAIWALAVSIASKPVQQFEEIVTA